MGFHDGAADPKSHSGPLGFRGKERMEDLMRAKTFLKERRNLPRSPFTIWSKPATRLLSFSAGDPHRLRFNFLEAGRSVVIFTGGILLGAGTPKSKAPVMLRFPETSVDPHHRNSSALREAIRKADIRSDGPGVVGQGVEKSPRLEAGKVECNDDMSHGSPPNLEISLIAEIAGTAGAGWINQDSASKSMYPVLR
jgi:hypothetical protein